MKIMPAAPSIPVKKESYNEEDSRRKREEWLKILRKAQEKEKNDVDRN